MGCPESLHVQRAFGEVCELRRECKGAAHYHKAPLRYKSLPIALALGLSHHSTVEFHMANPDSFLRSLKIRAHISPSMHFSPRVCFRYRFVSLPPARLLLDEPCSTAQDVLAQDQAKPRLHTGVHATAW